MLQLSSGSLVWEKAITSSGLLFHRPDVLWVASNRSPEYAQGEQEEILIALEPQTGKEISRVYFRWLIGGPERDGGTGSLSLRPS